MYIIDRYNKYDKNDNVRQTFNLRVYGQLETWCLREVELDDNMNFNYCEYNEGIDPIVEISKVYMNLHDAQHEIYNLTKYHS